MAIEKVNNQFIATQVYNGIKYTEKGNSFSDAMTKLVATIHEKHFQLEAF